MRLEQLQFLRVGTNRLTGLPTGIFTATTSLRVLHLENNQLSTPVPFGASLTQLTELYLQRNVFTELRNGSFDGLVALQELHLEMHASLKLIESGVFDPNSSIGSTLISLNMGGCRSSCVVTNPLDSPGNVSCSCDEGYVHPAGQRFACAPVDCGSQIPGLDENAQASCTTTTFNSTCNAICDLGFSGATQSSPAIFRCDAEGVWQGSVECTRVSCPDRIIARQDGISGDFFSGDCRADVRFGGSGCNVTCHPGYAPLGQNSPLFTCGGDGRWSGTYSCTPQFCGRVIQSVDSSVANNACDGIQQVYTPNSPEICYATCRTGFSGPVTPYVCGVDGLWVPGTNHSVRGQRITCSGSTCPRSGPAILDPNAYAQCRGNSAFGGDDCAISCRPGYTPQFGTGHSAGSSPSCDGQECVSCRMDGIWAQSSLVCVPIACEPTMANELALLGPAVNRSVSCANGTRYGDVCNVSCTRGFVPQDVQFRCDATTYNTGIWYGDIECAPFDCGPIETASYDSRAIVVENQACVGTNLSWDPVSLRCTDDNRWHASAPARRGLRCTSVNGILSEDRVATCDVSGWALQPDGNKPVDMANFCRLDCGSAAAADFQQCTEDTGVGATCTAACVTTEGVFATFACQMAGGRAMWVQTSLSGECLPGRSSAAATGGSSSLSTGVQVVVIIVPIVIIIALVIVLLYFFGYLKCIGLAWNEKRPGGSPSKKQITVMANPLYGASPTPPRQAGTTAELKKKKEEQKRRSMSMDGSGTLERPQSRSAPGTTAAIQQKKLEQKKRSSSGGTTGQTTFEM